MSNKPTQYRAYEYTGDSLVYSIIEVDEILAEKDKEIAEQKRLRDMALASVPNVLKVMKIIQHHKYKRCLAMAMWCIAEAKVSDDEYRMYWWVEWHKRWLAIAEKFKEVK